MGMKTYRRSRGNIHPGAAAGHKPADTDAKRDQQLRTVDTVCAYLPECPDCEDGGHDGPGPDGYCDRRIVLAVLFQPSFNIPEGSTPRTHDAILAYNGIVPDVQDAPSTGVTPEAQAFRRGCRAWGRLEGWDPSVHGSLDPDMEAAYRKWLARRGGAK